MYNSSEIAYDRFILDFFVDLLRSETKFNTYGAVSTQMTRLDFDLSAIGLAGRGYVDVQCWCAHGRYDVTPRREARKVIFSLRLRRPLHRRLGVCGSDDYSVVGFLATRSEVDAVRVSRSARHGGSAVSARCLFQLRQLRPSDVQSTTAGRKVLLYWPVCVEQSSCI